MENSKEVVLIILYRLILVTHLLFLTTKAFSASLCSTMLSQQDVSMPEIELARASHETRGAIFNKVKELYAARKAYQEDLHRYYQDETGRYKYSEVIANHHPKFIALSKEISELIAIELTRRGYEVEVFQSSMYKKSPDEKNPFRVRVLNFPQNKAGNFWRQLSKRFNHQLIFDIDAEVFHGRMGGVDNHYLYHSYISVLAEAPERFVTLFHEIVHLLERQKIKDGKPSSFSMNFELKDSDADLPMGYRRGFTLDEILANEKEINLLNSESYRLGILRSEIFENLTGEALKKQIQSKEYRVHGFAKWTGSKIMGLRKLINDGRFVVKKDEELGVPYAEIAIVHQTKHWFGLRKKETIEGEARIYLSPEWESANNLALQRHLLERLTATERELEVRLK